MYVVQELVNRFYEWRFNFLPVELCGAQARGRGGRGPGRRSLRPLPD